jgi:nucleotide sugar dehydrogenase
VDHEASLRAEPLFRLIGVPTHPVSLEVAEYAKLLENSYRLVNVAFVDQFAALCRAEGLDPREVVTAAATKPYGFQPFFPGVGAGGHCIAVDPAFLAWRGRQVQEPLPLLETALEANRERPLRLAAEAAAATSVGDTLLVVGLTYKAGVADLRESSALVVARRLAELQRRVLAFDSLVELPADLDAPGLDQGLSQADAVLLLVPQPEPVHSALLASGKILLDATGSLPGARRL